MSRERELLERALTQLNPWHPSMGERRFDYTLREEIREFLASEEPEKREPMNGYQIIEGWQEFTGGDWMVQPLRSFTAGVCFAEKYHGIGRKQ